MFLLPREKNTKEKAQCNKYSVKSTTEKHLLSITQSLGCVNCLLTVAAPGFFFSFSAGYLENSTYSTKCLFFKSPIKF